MKQSAAILCTENIRKNDISVVELRRYGYSSLHRGGG